MFVVAGIVVGASQGAQAPCDLVPQLRDVRSTRASGRTRPSSTARRRSSASSEHAVLRRLGRLGPDHGRSTLAVSGGARTVPTPTPVPRRPHTRRSRPSPRRPWPTRRVTPSSSYLPMSSRAAPFTATFSTTLGYRSRATNSAPYSAIQTDHLHHPAGYVHADHGELRSSFQRVRRSSSSPWATRRGRTRASGPRRSRRSRTG